MDGGSLHAPVCDIQAGENLESLHVDETRSYCKISSSLDPSVPLKCVSGLPSTALRSSRGLPHKSWKDARRPSTRLSNIKFTSMYAVQCSSYSQASILSILTIGFDSYEESLFIKKSQCFNIPRPKQKRCLHSLLLLFSCFPQ